MGLLLPKMNNYLLHPPSSIIFTRLTFVLFCFFNTEAYVWKDLESKSGELSARVNKREFYSAALFSLSLSSPSSSALPSRECFGAQLIFCLHNAFLQALYLCQSSFWSESGYHRLPTHCSCEWRNPPVLQDYVFVLLCVSSGVWSLRSRAGLPSINMAKWFPHMVKYLCKVIWPVVEPWTSGCDLHHRWFYTCSHTSFTHRVQRWRGEVDALCVSICVVNCVCTCSTC